MTPPHTSKRPTPRESGVFFARAARHGSTKNGEAAGRLPPKFAWGLSVEVGRSQRASGSSAFRVAAVQAGHAAVHHDDRGGAAPPTQLRALREVRLGKGVGLPGARLELGALLVDQLLLVRIELRLPDETDALQVLLDDIAELGDDRGHELSAGLPVTAARVEHRLQLIHQEGDVAALAEHRRD